MRVLILGGSGMLGHKLWQTFAPKFDTYTTVRRAPDFYAKFGIFDEARLVGGVSAEEFETVKRAFEVVRPEVVINCIGIVKQDAAAKNPVAGITVNALFPHQLAQATREIGARLIHLSTDCVFSGAKGNYSESALPDAQDLYGRTKALGEVDEADYENCLTLRTSMIGRELEGSHGLVEWFLSQRGRTVRGFKRAVFSGFTTKALADVIGEIITQQPELRGVWHFAAEPINKFDLLGLVKDALAVDIDIEPDENFVCDRSLNGERFRQATGFVPRPWPEMIEQLTQDRTSYDEIRNMIRRNDAG
jgi:dTDP-4-dehydrorhamnose reductase